MRNAADRKSIRLAEKFDRERETARINFVVAAMSTTAGRTYFHELLSACGIFHDNFSPDARLDARLGGQRSVGLGIYNDIVGNCPDHFVTMMKEATIKELTNDRRSEPDDFDDPTLSELGRGAVD